jgi:DNA helicase-2/ATP-dependent DNA helicase PcrA
MLNESQALAVETTEGPLIVFAGAGSGKTRVLVCRVARLIEDGVPPYRICAVTFTNKAANEMRERIAELVSDNSQNAVWVSTFHSLCVRILRAHIDKIGYANNFTVYDADDSDRLIKLCVKELNIDEKFTRQIKSVISSCKDNLTYPSELDWRNFREERAARVYELYQKKLRLADALDFDDLIFRTVELLRECEPVREKYQERFKYIMADEFQDTNKAQYVLMKILSEKHKNICVVGDDDQCIYGWRGADVDNILNFTNDFPQARMIKLEQNYRSSQRILEAANAVISNNFRRADKTLWTVNSPGAPPAVFEAESDREEAEFIAHTVRDLTAKGFGLKDAAILYRTNSQSRLIEEALINRGIPYRLYGGARFYERREIKDVVAYLRVIANPRDEISLRRIVNVPRRGIGDAALAKAYVCAAENSLDLFGALKKISETNKKIGAFTDLIDGFINGSKPLTELFIDVIDKTGYIRHLRREDPDNLDGREDNIKELTNKIFDFAEKNENASLEKFLEEISLVSDVDNYDETADAVSLSTVHAAKGLEFGCVFIAGMEEYIFPSYRSTLNESGLEEERRLFYVALTRAQKKVFITLAQKRMINGRIEYNSPSRFISEIPASLLELLN